MVRLEDETRDLFIGQTVPTEKMSYPSYSGVDSECFQDFEEKLAKALLHNKVRGDDKVDKLRKSLSGKAKLLVPESQKSFDNAMKALRKSYGDPTRLMRYRLTELKKHGKQPRSSKSVEWFLGLEVIIEGIATMAKRADDAGDEEVVNTLYSLEIIRTIASVSYTHLTLPTICSV